MQYGVDRRIYRAKLPIQVLRGFSPTEPNKLSSSVAPKDDEAIYSGMVIVRSTGAVGGVADQDCFRKALATDKTSDTLSFFVSLHDQDGHDVQAAGKLVGLDCSDDYEIQSGYFDPDVAAWVLDTPLTVADGGLITEATSGDTIIGYISAVGSNTDGSIPYTGKTPSTESANSDVIQFKTSRHGQAIPDA